MEPNTDLSEKSNFLSNLIINLRYFKYLLYFYRILINMQGVIERSI